MKLTCTKDSTHAMFSAAARILATVEVDTDGMIHDTVDEYDWRVISETGDPNFTCAVCGAPATREG